MKIKIFSFIAALVISSAAMATDLQLETIGAASGSNLYLTYLSIGVIADSHAKEVYNKDQSKSFVSSIVAQAQVQKNYLEKLLKSKEVSGADAEFLKKMIDCYTLLMDEGKYFVEYVNSGTTESLAAYDAKRQQAWALISELLGFDKK